MTITLVVIALLVTRGLRVPMVVEIIDVESQIQRYLQAIGGVIGSGIATTEKVGALRYFKNGPAPTGKRRPGWRSDPSLVLGRAHA